MHSYTQRLTFSGGRGLSTHRSDPQNYAPVAHGNSQSFSALIRESRLAAGLTQEELAERAGISARSVSDLERGLYQAPHRDTVARLAAALGLSAEAAAQLEAVVVRQRGPSTLPQQLEPEAPALPTGIVTFLAASSYASERSEPVLLGQLQAALDEYRKVVAQCVTRHGGIVVPTHGAVGILLAVFRAATDTVAAP